MSFLDALEPVARLFRVRERRAYVAEGRAYVELGDLGAAEITRFDMALRRVAAEDGRIRSIEVNAYTRRVLFVFEAGACDLSELVGWVETAERASGVALPRFQGAPEHPADD